MQFQHRFIGCRVDEIFGRDPGRELLFDVELGIIVAVASLFSFAVTGVLKVPDSDLHRLGQADHFWSGHFEHLLLIWHVDRLLDLPPALIGTFPVVFHEFLL